MSRSEVHRWLWGFGSLNIIFKWCLTFSTDRSCFGPKLSARAPFTPRAPKKRDLEFGLNVHDVKLVLLQPFGIDLNVALVGGKTQLILFWKQQKSSERVLQERFRIKKIKKSVCFTLKSAAVLTRTLYVRGYVLLLLLQVMFRDSAVFITVAPTGGSGLTEEKKVLIEPKASRARL